MHFELKYGDGSLPLDFDPSRILSVVLPKTRRTLGNARNAVERALAQPEGTEPLLEMLIARKPKKLVIIVNDITRPTPYSILMPPLVEVIEKAGIPDENVTILIATGIHDLHTHEQNLLVYGEEICRRFKIV